MSLAWFNSLYIVWALYWREGATYPRHVFAAPTFLRRITAEFVYAVVYGFTLLVLCLSWFIGLTRFWDDLHNISDIIGGFLLAVIFTTPAFLAAIGQYNVFQEAMDYDEIRRRHRGKPNTGATLGDDDNDGDIETLPVFQQPSAPAGPEAAVAPGRVTPVEDQQSLRQWQQQQSATLVPPAGADATVTRPVTMNDGDGAGGHVVVNMPSRQTSQQRHNLF
jgi:uncharacterized iron-regulated membrane protein